MDNQQLIELAINTRQQLTFDYKQEGFRIVEPYCLYKNKSNNIMLDCFQVSGFSSSEVKEGWRQFAISSISEVEVNQYFTFDINKQFNPNSERYKNNLCKVKQ